MRPPRLIAAGLAVLAAAAAGCSGGGPTAPAPAAPDETVQSLDLTGPGWSWRGQAQPLELGVTHTEFSLDPEEPAAARDRATAILRGNAGAWQNNHLMGFGTLNPEPAPGEFDWGSLDRRMELVTDTQGRTVLTLCCAPDWMKGGRAGETDWSRLEDAPDPGEYDDFAALAAAAVRRYPQVQRVLVWNELKGFYNSNKARWDYEGYTELYNKVYTAVKAARPDVLVGGPYVVLSSLDPGADGGSDLSGPWGVADKDALDVVEYWLKNKVGADFVAVDGGSETRQQTLPASVQVGAQKFADITAWIKERTDLPVWWAEFYPSVPVGEQGGASSPASAAATLATVAAYADSGVQGALLWSPQGDDGLDFSALWTDSRGGGGGLPTPLTAGWNWLAPRLAAGDVEIAHSATMPLLAFRAPDGALVVNLTGQDVSVRDGVAPVPGWSTTLTGRQP